MLPYEVFKEAMRPLTAEESMPTTIVERVYCNCGWNEILVSIPTYVRYQNDLTARAITCQKNHTLTRSGLIL